MPTARRSSTHAASRRPPSPALPPLPSIADDAAVDAARSLAAWRAAWARFLGDVAWNHFVTLTYERPASVGRASRDFLDTFVRRAAATAQRPLAWFYVVEGEEREHEDGGVHLHALVAGTAALTVAQLERAWRFGNTRVRVYDPTRGGADYVVKTMRPDDDAGGYARYNVSRRRLPQAASVGINDRSDLQDRRSISQNPAA